MAVLIDRRRRDVWTAPARRPGVATGSQRGSSHRTARGRPPGVAEHPAGSALADHQPALLGSDRRRPGRGRDRMGHRAATAARVPSTEAGRATGGIPGVVLGRSALGPSAGVVVRRFRALGTTAELVLPAGVDAVGEALAVLRDRLDAVDLACSRFRPDGEILRLARAGGRPVRVGPMLWEVVQVALAVAASTGGAVDPTVGAAVAAWGYDRDFAAVRARLGGGAGVGPEADAWVHAFEGARGAGARGATAGGDRGLGTVGDRSAVPGWRSIEMDGERHTVAVPAGTVVDLGATAKAWAADRVVADVADRLGCGVVVSLGGDVAVAGPPPLGGWPIGVAVDAGGGSSLEQVVAVSSGGLASSTPFVRSWWWRGRPVHHVIDPATGAPAPLQWRLVTVAAADCVTANAASTAALVWGTQAAGRLADLGVAARLVDLRGDVVTVGGWPT